MATADDGRAPHESGAVGEMFRKRHFRPGGNSASISATIGISKLEQMLQQMTFTSSETQRLIALLHSRTMEESSSPIIRFEASTTSSSLKKHKHGVVEEHIASPAKLPITSMASPQHQMTMEMLPDELLLNIFIRLSAKQLAQMRSVSKSWNSLLSQSSFVKSHLHRSSHNNDQILLVFHGSSNPKQFVAHRCRFPHLELTDFIKLPVNPEPEYTSISVIGSINGLICSTYGDSVIHIWNPSLSAVLTLPPYSMPSHDCDSIEIHFRFGFDPKTDDYKVVKLTGLTGPRTYAVRWWLQIEIYSMRKGSWELITERFPSHITNIIDGDSVCVDGHDGHLHWLGYANGEQDPKTIIAFDLGSETFREILFPNSIRQNRVNVLGVLSEKLCVMSYIEDVAYEVWVMDEYGVAESWVKRHVLSPFFDDTWPYGFTLHNEFLIEDNGYLVLYDSSANKQCILEDHCAEEYGVEKIVEYVESLVWVAPAKHEMLEWLRTK